ncbi:MAG TPA: DcaP family trimeric outer membrane transporter [Candidatus Polarisedimenticolia bacterium]|nr:DcaP family trimeric outer membrane transporter [Candidatus Polarisedimenticolia bacterium]
MRLKRDPSRTLAARMVGVAATLFLAAALAPGLFAQTEGKTRMDLYGFAMLDMGYEAKQSDPDWFDVMRPTKLPTFENQFGGDGHTYAGVRQSRFGVKTWTPAGKSEIKTIFEFELFGVGVDAGQTTFRLRHAWGEYGHFGAGQSWSPFMDPDVFPNSIEYWGPNGMVFFRNVQARWMPLMGKNEVFLALERPGASGDPGVLVGQPQIAGLQGHFPLPDLSGHYKMSRNWGHLQVAGILRKMKWDDTDPTAPNLSGSATGWGVNVSSNLKFNKDVLRLQVVYGEGIANYMNDATADVGATLNADIGEALPLLGVVAFYDKTWSDKWTSSFGYSMVDIDNSDGQAADAYKKGQYALANLLYYPVKNLMWGGELQWGDRTNNDDGGLDLAGNTVESADDVRLQFSVRYNFSHTLGG